MNCTGWFDGWWGRCCAAHDRAYAIGVEKTLADEALRICVEQAGTPLNAWIMWLGVTLFGWWWYRRASHQKS